MIEPYSVDRMRDGAHGAPLIHGRTGSLTTGTRSTAIAPMGTVRIPLLGVLAYVIARGNKMSEHEAGGGRRLTIRSATSSKAPVRVTQNG